jgi:hypothetical protein
LFGMKHDDDMFGALHQMPNDFVREGTALIPA